MRRYTIGLIIVLASVCAYVWAHDMGASYARAKSVSIANVGPSRCAEDTIAIGASVKPKRYACVALEDIDGSLLGAQSRHMTRYCGARNVYVYAPMGARYTMRCMIGDAPMR
jgi:hypothetical protein